jgi:hypothetical protein
MDFTKMIQKYTELIQPHNIVIKNLIVYVICILIFPSILSDSNYLYGILCTTVIIFYFYWIHVAGHCVGKKNLFSSIHIYHHKHNNNLSYYGQIFTEIIVVSIVVILNMYFNNTLTRVFLWMTTYVTILYSLVHTINYGVLQVNNYHQLHHKDPTTNFGPDICDYLCSSKHVETPHIEDVSHYLPPAILSFFFVLALKEFMKNATFTYIFNVVNILCVIIFLLLTLYIHYYL